MSIETFTLPDLGEGLPEAEIIQWHVKEGEYIKEDEPLVAVETAKAIVDVPAPQSGVVNKLHARVGDMVPTGDPLVDFGDASASMLEKLSPEMLDLKDEYEDMISVAPKEQDTDEDNHQDTHAPLMSDDFQDITTVQKTAETDQGTVVGHMPTSDRVTEDAGMVRKGSTAPRQSTRLKATPMVRALARQLNVALGDIEPTGRQGQITPNDVRSFAEGLTQTHAAHVPETAPEPIEDTPKVVPIKEEETQVEAVIKPADEQVDNVHALRGPMRTMSKAMSLSNAQVSACTLFDDADIHAWDDKQDITSRIVRSIAVAAKAMPSLNAWYNHDKAERTLHEHVDLALAVDTDDGLIVPVIRAVQDLSQNDIRDALKTVKKQTRERSVSPQDMLNPTITLSNFGMLAGRYATPVVVPPQVAIVGTGGIQHDPVAVNNKVKVHKRIPVSLTFDHRACTGGEACRFLAALLEDLSSKS